MMISWKILITLSFLFFFIFNLAYVSAAPTRHLCHPDQRDAILELKNEFEIMDSCSSGFLKMESWVNNTDCCSWEGIRCEAKSGNVIELNVSSSCLHGELNSKNALFRFQNFRFLTILDLSLNNFSGQFLPWLGNLSYLTTLDLSGNYFSGRIPLSITNLFRLKSLRLNDNDFVGEIPSSLGNLSYLNTLDLSGNHFSGRIPSLIGNLVHLTNLSLYLNNLVGEIPSSLGDLSHLTTLGLSLNNFSGEIPSSLGNLSHLTTLGLSQNNFEGQIPSSFGSLYKLESLFVHNNKLSGSFPFTLVNLTNLKTLSLYNNQLRGPLPSNWSSLSSLEYFSANRNSFTGTLPSSFLSITSLSYISLEDNQLDGPLEFGNISSNMVELRLGNNNLRGPIPISISKLVNLMVLDLSHLNTQGSVDFSILSHLKSLTSLYLSHLNTTTTIDLNTIFSDFKSLFALDLSGNRVHVSATNKMSVASPPSVLLSFLYLSDCGLTEFPQLLKTQAMIFLDVSNNKIQGEVPGWLWTLPLLHYVNLSNNTLIGFESPPELEPSSVRDIYMTYLFGSNNNFTGEIPSFLCEFPVLSTLDLSNNNFNGSIPRCIGNLSSPLLVLNLRQNRLSGSLPENMSESLKSLDVGHNQLVGKLPKSLVRISSLEVLNVESNKINDTFPFWLSSLQELQVLVIRSNAFHGSVQHTKFSKLRIIDISHNHFSGTLPSDFFVNWTAMSLLGKDEDQFGKNEDKFSATYMGTTYYVDSVVLMSKGIALDLVRILKIYTAIDFSGNKFEGEIPRSVGMLKQLRVLNFSNNGFTGNIPPSIANLKVLESLDVSRNKLSGKIPQELGKLTSLAYMNFSHNQLVGLVPGGPQFQTQPCSAFRDNLRLYGPSLDNACVDIHGKTSQHSEMPELEEDKEEVISWIAAAIGFIPGITLGFTIGYIFLFYKPEWFKNRFTRNKLRSISTAH